MTYSFNSARANLMGDSNGLGVAIVYSPDTRKISGPIGFAIPKEGGSGLESESLYLHQGVQFVEEKQWDRIASHPTHAERISKLIRRRILGVYRPTIPKGGLATGTTVDFEEKDDALLLVENSFSLEWLRASYAQETARQDLKKAIGERLNTVSKLAEERKIPMSALGG